MLNQRMIQLGTNRSAIRELFEFGKHYEHDHGEGSVLDFSLGNPSAPLPEVAEKVMRELIGVKGVHDYTSAPGDIAARKLLAASLDRRFGGEFTFNHLYMTMGASAALTIAFCALTSEEDEIVLLAPYFPEYMVFAQRAGAKVVVVSADEEFNPDFEQLERAINPHTALVVVNSPNNPSGKVYSRATLERLADILTAKSQEIGHPVYLVSDEPYREITYGAEVAWIPSIYPDTVVCYSWSKSLSLPGERIGYVAVNPACRHADDIIAAVAGAGRSLGYVCASSLFQRVVASLPDTTCDVNVYKTNRDLLYTALNGMGYHCISPDGAFYLMVKSPLGDGQDFSDRAKELGLLIVPGESFGVKDWVRIAYCVPKERIERAIPLFEKLAPAHE